MASPFQNAVAVVTGGGGGLGRALCDEMGRRGAIVVVTDLLAETAEGVAAAIVAAGGRATGFALDVRDAAAFERLLDETIAAHGRLDYLFNNAGIAVAGEAQNLSLEVWKKAMDINLWGVIHGASAAYSRMLEQGSGHLVNIASLAGLGGMALGAPYAATKFGVVGLSITLRAEGADLGVKVSVVCPAYIRTGIFDNGTYVGTSQKGVESLIPFKYVDVDVAAAKILRGVERNAAIIVFPFYARLLWWLYRLRPQIVIDVHRKTAQAFRRRAARASSGKSGEK